VVVPTATAAAAAAATAWSFYQDFCLKYSQQPGTETGDTKGNDVPTHQHVEAPVTSGAPLTQHLKGHRTCQPNLYLL
jgi:hypothetical protein